MEKLVFADGHMHSNPVKGLGIENIAKRFSSAGGWFIALVSLPPHHFGFDNSFDGYVKSVDVLIRECRAGKELGLKMRCFAGVHPAAVEDEISKNPKQSMKILEKALMVIDHIAKLVKNGLIDGFGEVGRPHYKSLPEAFIANTIILKHTLTLAKDLGAWIHLHLEQGGEITAFDISETVKAISIDKKLTILHHLDIATARHAQQHQLIFTVPGKIQVLKEAFKSLKPMYMVESDFIDDPKRPGVSSYPWDIVDNQKKLLLDGIVDENYLYKLNVDMVSKTYDVEPP